MFVILTWSGQMRIYDADLIRDETGEAKTFHSFVEAEEWQTDNDGELSTYSKIINLSD